jgi:hypothetical protein
MLKQLLISLFINFKLPVFGKQLPVFGKQLPVFSAGFEPTFNH